MINKPGQIKRFDGEIYWGRINEYPQPPISGGRIRGWAGSIERRLPAKLLLVVNGSIVAVVEPSFFRRLTVGIFRPTLEFTLSIPKSLWNFERCEYAVCFADSNEIIMGGSFIAVLDNDGDLVELDRTDRSPTNRLLLPWHRPPATATLKPEEAIPEFKRLVSVGERDRAAKLLRETYNAFPHSQPVLQRLAKIYAGMKRYEDALNALSCILTLNPSDHAAIARTTRMLIDCNRSAELDVSLLFKPYECCSY